MRRHFLFVSAALMLTACGFHLRGSQNSVPLSFKTLAIAGESSSLVAQNLRDQMRGQVIIVTPPTPAQVTVEIGTINHNRYVLTKDSDGRATEYRMNASVTMQAYAANKDQLISPVTLSVNRTMSVGNGYDTAIDLETARVYADMDRDLANQIQYRLRAIKPVQ